MALIDANFCQSKCVSAFECCRPRRRADCPGGDGGANRGALGAGTRCQLALSTKGHLKGTPGLLQSMS